MRNHRILSNLSSFNKGILIRGYDLQEEGFQPICNNFGDNLICKVAKAYRPKMIEIVHMLALRDKDYESLIDPFRSKTLLNKVDHLLLGSVLVSPVEKARETI